MKSVVNKFHGSYIQKIFDPVQTHAMYGVHSSRVGKAKESLKEIGANRFRIVRAGAKDLRIICFKLKNNP